MQELNSQLVAATVATSGLRCHLCQTISSCLQQGAIKCGVGSQRKYAILFGSQQGILIFATKSAISKFNFNHFLLSTFIRNETILDTSLKSQVNFQGKMHKFSNILCCVRFCGQRCHLCRGSHRAHTDKEYESTKQHRIAHCQNFDHRIVNDKEYELTKQQRICRILCYAKKKNPAAKPYF